MRDRTAVQGSGTLVREVKDVKAVIDAADFVDQLFATPANDAQNEVAQVTLAPATRPKVSPAAEPGTYH